MDFVVGAQKEADWLFLSNMRLLNVKIQQTYAIITIQGINSNPFSTSPSI